MHLNFHIMLRNILTLLIILSSSIVIAQDFEGTFKEGDNYLIFEKNTAKFNMDDGMNLLSNIVGEGTYTYADNYLLINTTDYSGTKTEAQSMVNTKKDTLTISVINQDNFFEKGVLIELLNDKNKVLVGGVTNDAGIALFKTNLKVKKIRVYNMGHDDIILDYDPTNDYRIKLAKNEVVENQVVAFAIKKIDDDTLSVLMLTTEYQPGKEPEKTLDKLSKKSQKRKVIEKRMKRMY